MSFIPGKNWAVTEYFMENFGASQNVCSSYTVVYIHTIWIWTFETFFWSPFRNRSDGYVNFVRLNSQCISQFVFFPFAFVKKPKMHWHFQVSLFSRIIFNFKNNNDPCFFFFKVQNIWGYDISTYELLLQIWAITIFVNCTFFIVLPLKKEMRVVVSKNLN